MSRSPLPVPGRRRRLALAATALGILAAFGPSGVRGDDRPPLGSLTRPGVPLTALEGVHTDLVSVFPPLRRGAVVVLVRSPSHRLVLHRSWLHVRPHPPGRTEGAGREILGEVVVDLEGEGEIVADVIGGGLAQELRDEVTVPRQVVRLAGRAELRRVAGGFDVRILELPDRMPLRIESALARRLVEVCGHLEAIPFVALDCSGLDGALSRVEVPLPSAGETVRVPDDLLGADGVALLTTVLGGRPREGGP